MAMRARLRWGMRARVVMCAAATHLQTVKECLRLADECVVAHSWLRLGVRERLLELADVAAVSSLAQRCHLCLHHRRT